MTEYKRIIENGQTNMSETDDLSELVNRAIPEMARQADAKSSSENQSAQTNESPKFRLMKLKRMLFVALIGLGFIAGDIKPASAEANNNNKSDKSGLIVDPNSYSDLAFQVNSGNPTAIPEVGHVRTGTIPVVASGDNGEQLHGNAFTVKPAGGPETGTKTELKADEVPANFKLETLPNFVNMGRMLDKDKAGSEGFFTNQMNKQPGLTATEYSKPISDSNSTTAVYFEVVLAPNTPEATIQYLGQHLGIDSMLRAYMRYLQNHGLQTAAHIVFDLSGNDMSQINFRIEMNKSGTFKDPKTGQKIDVQAGDVITLSTKDPSEDLNKDPSPQQEFSFLNQKGDNFRVITAGDFLNSLLVGGQIQDGQESFMLSDDDNGQKVVNLNDLRDNPNVRLLAEFGPDGKINSIAIRGSSKNVDPKVDSNKVLTATPQANQLQPVEFVPTDDAVDLVLPIDKNIEQQALTSDQLAKMGNGLTAGVETTATGANGDTQQFFITTVDKNVSGFKISRSLADLLERIHNYPISSSENPQEIRIVPFQDDNELKRLADQYGVEIWKGQGDTDTTRNVIHTRFAFSTKLTDGKDGTDPRWIDFVFIRQAYIDQSNQSNYLPNGISNYDAVIGRNILAAIEMRRNGQNGPTFQDQAVFQETFEALGVTWDFPVSATTSYKSPPTQ